MIKVSDVWHHYGVKPVLKNVSLEVPAGELLVVMGPNGMGKSTLLGLIGGVLSPLKGYVEINGRRRRNSIEEETAIRKEVVYLPDAAFLPVNVTGREHVLAMGRIYGIEEEMLMKHVDLLLDVFDLAEKADSPIQSYSTGQKKKVGLCGALATEAKIMVLDEPFSGGLDTSALLAMSKILAELAHRSDVTVVMAVPVPELVEPIADKIAVISHGEIIAHDSPAALREKAGGDTLTEVLEKLLGSKVIDQIDSYLKERAHE